MAAARAARSRILTRLLDRHGRTYADELGIRLRRGGPPELFQLLVAALLMSARISTDIAVAAARALFDRGYLDARAMLDASWQDRVDALGEGHYVRYDESTATYLADTSTLLLERYDGDLRRLREEAERDPQRIHELLQQAKGIGKLGADIFCREAQTVWTELRPFADRSALKVADELGLGDSAASLARLHGDDDLSQVTAALLRAKGAKDLEVLREGREAPPTETQLATSTKPQLYRLAQEHDVPGRSSMTRQELVDALHG
jgi:endonuclease III